MHSFVYTQSFSLFYYLKALFKQTNLFQKYLDFIFIFIKNLLFYQQILFQQRKISTKNSNSYPYRIFPFIS